MRYCIMAIIMAAAMMTACGNSKKDGGETAETTLKTTTVKYEKKNKKAEVTITADYPTEGNAILTNAIREFISEKMGGTYTGDLADGNALVSYYGKEMTGSMEELADEYDGEDGMPAMAQSMTFGKAHETGRYVTYTMDSYVYMGGAHGMPGTEGATFRKSDGRRFGYDMLRETGSDNFRMLIKEGLKEYFAGQTEDDVTDQTLPGFLLGDHDINYLPLPAAAPYLTKEGVAFVYQSYEIAPYAAGHPTFVIPYSKIKPYLTVTALRMVE